jgi:hypothetical protein
MIKSLQRKAFSSELMRQATISEGKISLQVRFGDITREDVDVIVNKANSSLTHDKGLALQIS